MKRWITLNQKISGIERQLYVNAENISCLAATHDDDGNVDGSHLYLHGREGFFVLETPDEIMRMIRITLKPC